MRLLLFATYLRDLLEQQPILTLNFSVLALQLVVSFGVLV
jgi:hypothetical protein